MSVRAGSLNPASPANPVSALAEPVFAGDASLAVVFGLFRLMGYASLALLAGGVVFLVVCAPGAGGMRRMRRLLLVGWAGGVVSALVVLPLQAQNAAGLPLAGELDPDLLLATLGTDYGRFVLARIGLLLLGGLLLLALLRDPDRVQLRVLTAVVLIVALPASWHGTGHANASEDVLAAVANVVHLAAMSAWLGGLAVLVWCARDFGSAAPAIAFSRLAAIAVALVTLSGLYRAWGLVGSFDALVGTAYGRLIVIKLAVIATLLWLGSLSRGAVRRWAADAGKGRARRDREALARRQLIWTVRGEVVAAVVVLAVTSLLVATSPGHRSSPSANALAEAPITSASRVLAPLTRE